MMQTVPEKREGDAGFTLLEVLVALAVLAVGAVSLLTATQTHVARISDIEERTVARWVADNSLAAARLGEEQQDRVTMLGRQWRVGVTRQATADPALERVNIGVALASARSDIFTLTGFVDIGANAEGGTR